MSLLPRIWERDVEQGGRGWRSCGNKREGRWRKCARCCWNCPVGGLAVGASTQVILSVALDESLAPGAEVTVESKVESSTPEAIPDNNRMQVDLALLPAADFQVTSLEEGSDLSPGDGVCAAAGGCRRR